MAGPKLAALPLGDTPFFFFQLYHETPKKFKLWHFTQTQSATECWSFLQADKNSSYRLILLTQKILSSIVQISGYCIVVVPLPSKQEVRVRFPLSAPCLSAKTEDSNKQHSSRFASKKDESFRTTFGLVCNTKISQIYREVSARLYWRIRQWP